MISTSRRPWWWRFAVRSAREPLPGWVMEKVEAIIDPDVLRPPRKQPVKTDRPRRVFITTAGRLINYHELRYWPPSPTPPTPRIVRPDVWVPCPGTCGGEIREGDTCWCGGRG